MLADHEAMAAPALECAENAGASYADVRIVEERERTIGVRLGEVGQIRQSESLGTGVRVLVDGAWGYAAAPDPTADTWTSWSRERLRCVSAEWAGLLPESPTHNSYRRSQPL